MSTAVRARLVLSVAVLAVAMSGAVALPAQASAPARSELELVAESLSVRLHNEARQDPGAYGYGSLAPQAAMTAWTDIRDVSRSWADRMAAEGRMYHNPSYASQLCCWSGVGENVAWRGIYGSGTPTAADIEEATRHIMQGWMDSDGHRKNIMKGSYSQFAIGASLWTGTRTIDGKSWQGWELYLTANFRDPNSATIPGEPYAGPGAGTTTSAPAPEPRDITDTCDDMQSVRFRDVLAGSTHGYAVQCIATYGITQGKDDGSYDPGGRLTKGQTATFLARTLETAGRPLAAGSDVCRNAGVHEQALESLIEAGIASTSDCDADTSITRDRMALWVDRALSAAGVTASGSTDWFSDDDSSPFETAINRVTDRGVVTGKGDGCYGPSETLTRAQMATFLARTLDAFG